MTDKIQVLFIHGGMTFKNNKDYLNFLRTKEAKINVDSWSREYLKRKLSHDFEVINPRMPLQDKAKYSDWKIVFETYIPKLKNNLILIGVSLGGVFLARYLSENIFPKKILALYLVGAPFDDTLPHERLVGGFKLKKDLSPIEKNCEMVNLLFSSDDDVVPLSHAQKYANKLKRARLIIYDKVNGHFKVPEFPEIIKLIKTDYKKIKN